MQKKHPPQRARDLFQKNTEVVKPSAVSYHEDISSHDSLSLFFPKDPQRWGEWRLTPKRSSIKMTSALMWKHPHRTNTEVNPPTLHKDNNSNTRSIRPYEQTFLWAVAVRHNESWCISDPVKQTQTHTPLPKHKLNNTWGCHSGFSEKDRDEQVWRYCLLSDKMPCLLSESTACLIWFVLFLTCVHFRS